MWTSTRYRGQMATDRAADRHLNGKFTYRPSPSDLLKRLDQVKGQKSRSEILSELLSAYLAGEPMPARSWVPGESGDTGQDHAV